jgi:hypothetical protein
MKKDRAEPLSIMADSFDRFRRLLLAHAVERVPFSVQVFEFDDVAPIVDYITNSYYRHFQLYRFVLCARPTMELVQSAENAVESPLSVKPLQQALVEE